MSTSSSSSSSSFSSSSVASASVPRDSTKSPDPQEEDPNRGPTGVQWREREEETEVEVEVEVEAKENGGGGGEGWKRRKHEEDAEGGQRGWGGVTQREEEGVEEEERRRKLGRHLKKRKVVMVVGYCGLGYSGFQANPGVDTIESHLFRALADAGAISEMNAGDPNKFGWTRAGRTDKGVHAVRQVVALKMLLVDEDRRSEANRAILERINAALPDSIRVFGMRKCANSFNSKNMAFRRRYEYILPSFALLRGEEKDGRPDEKVVFENHSWKERHPDYLSYRIDTEMRDRLAHALSLFEGTRRYHNYTSGLSPKSDSAKRFMEYFRIEEVFESHGIEFLRLQVFGQSFLLHQIRKMVAAAVLVARGSMTEEMMMSSFDPDMFVPLPKAPPLGLYLDYVDYMFYERKHCSLGSSDPIHECLDWAEEEKIIQDFKASKIIGRITSEEYDLGVTCQWVEHLERFAIVQLQRQISPWSQRPAHNPRSSSSAVPLSPRSDSEGGDMDD